MFENILDDAAQAAGKAAGDKALGTFAKTDQEREALLAERLETENLGVVKELENIGEELDVPSLVQDLSATMALHPRFEGAVADCTPFSWMPERRRPRAGMRQKRLMTGR